MERFHFIEGTAPLLVSMPHVGTHLPVSIAARLTEAALRLPDTDWHLERLYDFLGELGASILVATHSRYVIDLNRPPDDASLYPGQDTTGLLPIDTGTKAPVYKNGIPQDAEKAHRLETYWKPYHEKLAVELERIRTLHGYALLWDAHSIASVLPRFFPGRLTDLNLGTADGASCGAQLGEKLLDVAKTAQGYSSVLNGRFKGGYITRRYGEPARNIYAVQLELTEITYMNEPFPYEFRDDLAGRVRPHLRKLLQTMLAEQRDADAGRYRVLEGHAH